MTTTEGELFKRCRRALGLSQSETASAMLVVSDRTIRRWEDGDREVAGPAWVALEVLLRQAHQPELATEVKTLIEHRRAANLRRTAAEP